MECAVHSEVVLVVCHAAAVKAACVALVFNWALCRPISSPATTQSLCVLLHLLPNQITCLH
jgi:hypothetical protein